LAAHAWAHAPFAKRSDWIDASWLFDAGRAIERAAERA
jgi:hypothetical protein